MNNSKLYNKKIKFTCIVLAFVMLFSSAQILAAELGKYANVAMAQTVEDNSSQSSSAFGDLTTGSNDVYLPNYDTQVITETDLPVPEVKTFGAHDVDYYPSYINQLDAAHFSTDIKADILAENKKILADAKDWFNAGTLRQNLQKHVSADGQFYNAKGNYNDAPRIEKVTMINNHTTPRKRSLGVFAPAGEVLTVTIDERLVGKVTVNIGYPLGGECDIDTGAFGRWYSDRMPRFFMEFPLTSKVTEIGSPLGGMVTMNSVSTDLGNFSITVRGGIDMPDYKLGVSTKEDWENALKAPAPYVWLLTPYQHFVMPKVEIDDIEDPANALLWWHKAQMISLYAMARESDMTPIVSVFDSYVYTGEAVAKVWAFVTNAPTYWCHGILDYDNLMYTGAWGALHEFNHHYQSHGYYDHEWGVGGIDEVTNNVNNIASYIYLTDVALSRTESSAPSGWGSVSDPYYNYKTVEATSKRVSTYEGFDTSKAYAFADMMHTLGAGRYLDFIRAQYGVGEVEGYTGTNLTQDGYLNTQDGFALFSSLFFKLDFVDYLTRVWHFNLSQSVIDQIKGYNFDEYFSLNNLYSAGIKGIETGRPYKINIGTTNVLKFNQYTLCSTDDFALESVSEPQHGKLTDNGDGTYNYLPDDDFTQDSFDLVYKVTLNGKIYYRTLVVKFVANYNYIETATYNVAAGNNGLSAEQAAEQFVREDNVVSRGTARNFTTSTLNGTNITTFKAKVVFPFTKQLTFMVYGDDKSWLRIDDETAFTSTYIANDAAGKNHATNKIEMTVNAGQVMEFEAYCFNTGGAGNLRVKYSEDGGETYKDIPSSYCYGYNVSETDIEKSKQKVTNVYPAFVDFRNMYLNKWYSNYISYTPIDAKCLDNAGNPVKTVDGANINALFDGNLSTGFHTAWWGSITNYPHNYYFTFEEPIQFNRLDLFFNANWNYYAIGDYELYTSMDGDEYNLIYAGSNTGGNFEVHLGATAIAKYVKLVVKSNAGGQKFTNIMEIKFLQEINYGVNYNIYASNNDMIEYSDGTWEDVEGNFVNNKGKHTDEGTIKFYLTGSDLVLYSINETSVITIDGIEHTIHPNYSAYSPSFLIDGLTYTKHFVEIKANDMTVDVIKTSGAITEVFSFTEERDNIVVEDQMYNGKQLRPILSYKGATLIEGVDYFVTSIWNNQNIGVATFTVKALGENSGTFEGTFNILPVHLDNTNVSFGTMPDFVYTGNSITLDFTITLYLDGEELVLQEGTDYDVSYLNNVELGTATIIITFKGNFSGNATGYFNIVNRIQPSDPSNNPTGGSTHNPSSGSTSKEPTAQPNYEFWLYVVSGVAFVMMLGILAVVMLLVKKKK